eukprot:5663541-Prymnesium_polylepis.1
MSRRAALVVLDGGRACDTATWTNGCALVALARKALSANPTLSTDLLSPGFEQPPHQHLAQR